MKFSYNWLNSFFKEDLPQPEKLAEKLMMHFFEVEGVEKKGDDFLLDIDILPSRASDCFSHLGVAGEIAVILEKKVNFPEIESDDGDLESVKVEVENNQLCPRYVLRVIDGIKVGETPEFIKKRLEICGLQSVNNIVDITNYVMLEMGQPLHSFDGEKIAEDKIIVRNAEPGEKIETLDDDKYKLDESVLVIADEEKPIGIAGIKGGKGSEVEEETSLIYLEAANFEAKTIRRTSKKLKLRTDASARFEQGLDPELAEKASKRAAQLFEEYAGGKTVGRVDFYPQKRKPGKLKLSLSNLKSVLGTDIDKARVKSILKRLRLNPKVENDSVKVTVPTGRNDLQLEEDLIEEVGRVYGYENIDPKVPRAALTGPETNYDIFWEDRARDVFKSLGYNEVYNYSFINVKTKKLFGFNDNLIEMENPVSKEYQFLRPSLIPGLIKNVKDNEKKFRNINIFEIGKVFGKENEEKRKLSGLKTTDFRDLKGDMDVLLERLGVGKASYKTIENKKSFWSRELAEVKVKQETVGLVGKISKDFLKGMKIESQIFLFQIDMDQLAALASEKKQYERISRFPTAVRDLSALVPKRINYEEFVSVAENAGGELLVDVDLFDLYEGEKIPEEKKNFGIRLFFQAEDKTLSKEEINELLEKIISTLEKKSGWEVRKK